MGITCTDVFFEEILKPKIWKLLQLIISQVKCDARTILV